MSNSSLGHRAAQAFGWNMLGSVFRSLSGFAVNVILSRLLGPEPFGTMAIVLTLLSFTTLVLDSGLSVSLIQRQSLTDENVGHVQGIQLVVGLFLAGLIWLLAYPVSLWFRQPELLPIIPYLAAMIVLTALSQVPLALLRRRLDFRAVQHSQIVSYTVGYILIGIPMGFLDFGIWSLITAQLVQLSVGLIWISWQVGRFFRPRLRGDQELLTFGMRVLATNLVNWLTMNADTFAVGAQFGRTTLGVYNRMTFLLGTPLNILTSSIQTVLVSIVARIQTEPGKVKEAYLAMVELVAWVTLPLFLSLAFLGQTLIEGIYGAAWNAGVVLVAPICTFMAISSLGALPGPVLTGLGQVRIELRNTTVNLVISLPILTLASLHSMVVLAWAVAISRLSFCIFLNCALAGQLEFRFGEYLSRIVYPLLAALLLGGGLALLDGSLEDTGLSSLFRLLLLAAIGASIYGIVFLKFADRMLGETAKRLLLEIGPYRRIRYKIDRNIHHI